ncbi:hypothetical protein [Filomicrobium sp.]|uniref:hypothetical protein n=1 Tax=Filomicrobium sp. TaxID=2024831 RepID=UPI00258DE170|nr:hypothetical protein [Filomicrobium sp.]MCV0369515.1 hypothetical protein [Filomicrobium sp.]
MKQNIKENLDGLSTLHGESVYSIHFDGVDNSIKAGNDRTLTISVDDMRSSKQVWIIEAVNGNEVCRHNTQYLASVKIHRP